MKLTQNTTGNNIIFEGFTVKPEMFYGTNREGESIAFNPNYCFGSYGELVYVNSWKKVDGKWVFDSLEVEELPEDVQEYLYNKYKKYEEE